MQLYPSVSLGCNFLFSHNNKNQVSDIAITYTESKTGLKRSYPQFVRVKVCMRLFTRKMPAYKNVPVSWRMYSMVISRLQINHAVKEAFLWAATKNYNDALTIMGYIQLPKNKNIYSRCIGLGEPENNAKQLYTFQLTRLYFGNIDTRNSNIKGMFLNYASKGNVQL